MANEKKLVQCIPNFSEGRDLKKVEKIVEAFRAKEGVKLLDYSTDENHNRCVVDIVGEPEAVKCAMIEAIGIASEVIDMRVHEGQHPRMGATDVVPFVPIKNMSMTEAVELSKEVAKEVAEKFNISVFLYEKSASCPERENLAKVRKGQYEGMAEKLQQPEWKPDFGPTKLNEKAGVTAIGARMPLVAFNVNLNTNRFEVADAIARKVRHIGGGLRFCKAIGINLEDRGIVQVSMNMVDYTKTALYRAFELIKIEARRYGVTIAGSEVIGLVPMQALADTAEYYLQIENFSMDQILENKLME